MTFHSWIIGGWFCHTVNFTLSFALSFAYPHTGTFTTYWYGHVNCQFHILNYDGTTCIMLCRFLSCPSWHRQGHLSMCRGFCHSWRERSLWTDFLPVHHVDAWTDSHIGTLELWPAYSKPTSTDLLQAESMWRAVPRTDRIQILFFTTFLLLMRECLVTRSFPIYHNKSS